MLHATIAWMILDSTEALNEHRLDICKSVANTLFLSLAIIEESWARHQLSYWRHLNQLW
jgi:hypothetical protein